MDVIPARVFPVNAEALDEALRHIETQAAALGFNRSVQLKLVLVAEELCTNVLNHAQHAQLMELQLSRDEAGCARLMFADDGPAFNPLQNAEAWQDLAPEDRPVGGLGIVLVQGFCAQVDYSRRGGQNRLDMLMLP
ncbi:MAG: ATP-binding protein [Rhodocyclaceae bacterium]|nr:ATP-binding protein [Rhodocyclaceae bacterium]